MTVNRRVPPSICQACGEYFAGPGLEICGHSLCFCILRHTLCAPTCQKLPPKCPHCFAEVPVHAKYFKGLNKHGEDVLIQLNEYRGFLVLPCPYSKVHVKDRHEMKTLGHYLVVGHEHIRIKYILSKAMQKLSARAGILKNALWVWWENNFVYIGKNRSWLYCFKGVWATSNISLRRLFSAPRPPGESASDFLQIEALLKRFWIFEH